MYRTKRREDRVMRLFAVGAAFAALIVSMKYGSLSSLGTVMEKVLAEPAAVAAILGTEPPLEASPEPEPPKQELILPLVTPAPASESFPTYPIEGLLWFGDETTAVSPSPGETYTISPEALRIENGSDYDIDPRELMPLLPDFRDHPKVLILHTHTCEAYTPDGEDLYTESESDTARTLDPEYNVIRVGNVLASELERQGISVIHDTQTYDYPSYSGSYSRALDAIDEYLMEDPEIGLVIDLHRDALVDSDGNVYSTSCTVNGEPSAQILLVSGTDSSGLWHPEWRGNVALALWLQGAMDAKFPGLARPTDISQYRYNQHATPGSLILEVGCSGDTLQEALRAVRLFAEVYADVLQGRVELAE